MTFPCRFSVLPVKGLFDIILFGMGKNARFRDVFLAACAVACSGIFVGCVTVPQRQGVTRTFRFPFLHERHGPAAVYANWKEGGE